MAGLSLGNGPRVLTGSVLNTHVEVGRRCVEHAFWQLAPCLLSHSCSQRAGSVINTVLTVGSSVLSRQLFPTGGLSLEIANFFVVKGRPFCRTGFQLDCK